jgi:hypothetical protein
MRFCSICLFSPEKVAQGRLAGGAAMIAILPFQAQTPSITPTPNRIYGGPEGPKARSLPC